MQPNIAPYISWAIGAGFASAVMLAAAARVPAVAAPLLFLTGLPIAVSGLVSNAGTAVAAALVSALLLGVVIGLPVALAHSALVAMPVAFLVHRALLQREPAGGGTEWYPPGRIGLWAALIGGCISAVGLMLASGGGDVEKLEAGLKQGIESSLQAGIWGLGAQAPVNEEQKVHLVQVMLAVLPGTLAALSMLSLIACLWLGGHLALASGRLVRPWPDIASFSFPAGTPLLLAVTLAGGFLLEGFPRLIVEGFAGALFTAYVLAGLAIVHHTTRGIHGRGAILGAVYAALIFFSGLAALVLAMTALVDAFMPLRRPTSGSN